MLTFSAHLTPEIVVRCAERVSGCTTSGWPGSAAGPPMHDSYASLGVTL